jgi:hypothetical protein
MAGPVAGAPTTDLVEMQQRPSRDRGTHRRALDRMQTGGLKRASMATLRSAVFSPATQRALSVPGDFVPNTFNSIVL